MLPSPLRRGRCLALLLSATLFGVSALLASDSPAPAITPPPGLLLPAAVASRDAAALARAEAALAQLSLEEKIALLAGNGTMSLAAQPKIGLVDEFWFSDGPHTVRPELARNNFNSAGRDDDHATVLPTLVALAATWDEDLALCFGELLGREARARGKDLLLGPGINLLRTPLNGRNYEYLGEDPFLAARLAAAYVRGVQSQDVGACVKHFAGNEQELERGSVDVQVGERALRELYLVPFEAAVVEAGALSVMNGYNRLRGEYCSHSAYLNRQVLKTDWGFPGFVVTDWGSLHDTVAGALGGLDVEMNAGEAIKYFRQPLLDAVRDGRVPAATIDDMARRVLYVMAKIGKLGGHERAPGERNTPAHQAFAREVAEQAIVLLKNERDVLPLDRARVRRLLVIGANADIRHHGGFWSAEGKSPYETTPLDALRALLGKDVLIEHLPGPFADSYEPLPEAVIQTVDQRDLSRGAAQKGWRSAFFAAAEPGNGEPAANGFSKKLDFKGQDAPKNPALKPGEYSARWSVEISAPEAGEYVLALTRDGAARLKLDGRVILDAWTSAAAVTGEKMDTARVTLEAGARHLIEIDHRPAADGGRLLFGWRLPSRRPITPEQLAARAGEADAVLFFTGNRLGHGRALEGEGADRPSLALPEGDDEAVAAVLSARPDTVVINQSGAPVALPWIHGAATLVQYWFSGMEGGPALARILFGEASPSGRLPFTMPRRLEDSPAHALGNYGPVRVNYDEGVFIGYRWHDARDIEPLFPFGHGLGYTSFETGSPEIVGDEPKLGRPVTVRVAVANTGRRAGVEVVQLYVGDTLASVPRPPRELKGFRKVQLAPGETREVEFVLQPRDFAFWDEAAAGWRVEPGEFVIHAGASSRALSAPLTITLR